jgi:hypothetical protein
MTQRQAAAALLLAPLLAGANLPPWTPALVATLVNNVGLPAASRDFASRNNAGWTQILAGIQSGNPAWLALVPRLKPTPNAAAAGQIPIALSLALPAQPASVLALLPATYPIGRICADIRIEPTRAQSRDYYRRAIAAVAPLHQPTAAACLASLTHAARKAG